MRQILKRTVSTPCSLLPQAGENQGEGEGTKTCGWNLWQYDRQASVFHSPSLGTSRPCDGHQPLNALWLKPSNERIAKSEERQEVEAGSRSSKTKRQQMKHLLFPVESTPQLCSAGHCSRRWVSGAPRAVTWTLTAAWNQPSAARIKCCSFPVKPHSRARRL